jgi:hypothetical protein
MISYNTRIKRRKFRGSFVGYFGIQYCTRIRGLCPRIYGSSSLLITDYCCYDTVYCISTYHRTVQYALGSICAYAHMLPSMIRTVLKFWGFFCFRLGQPTRCRQASSHSSSATPPPFLQQKRDDALHTEPLLPICHQAVVGSRPVAARDSLVFRAWPDGVAADAALLIPNPLDRRTRYFSSLALPVL